MAAGDKDKKEKDFDLTVQGVGTFSKSADLAVKIPSFQIGLQYLETYLPEVKVKLSFLDKDDKLIKSKNTEEIITGKNGLLFYPKKKNQEKVKADFCDIDDNLAKCLSLSARKALKDKKEGKKKLYHVLTHSPDILKSVVTVYDKYTDTIGGKDFIEDIYNSKLIPEEQLDILLSIAKLDAKTKIKVIPLASNKNSNEIPVDPILGDIGFRAVPNNQSVLPNTPITYKITPPPIVHMTDGEEVTIYRKYHKYDDYKFQWFCFNDPSEVYSGNIKEPIVKGSTEYQCESEAKKSSDNLHWGDVGNHRVICKVEEKGNHKPRIFQYEQQVDLFENILNKGFYSIDLKKQLNPDEAVKKTQDNFVTYFKRISHVGFSREELFEEKFSDGVEVVFDRHKNAKRQLDFIIGVKKFLADSEGQKRIPIKAYYVTEPEHARHSALNVFIYKSVHQRDHQKWNIVDWTNPQSPKTSCKASGRGKNAREAILAAIIEWQDDNTYPAGLIKLEIPIIEGETNKTEIFLIKGNGSSTLQIIAEVFSIIGMILLVIAAIIFIFVPVPGSRVLSATIWAGIAASTTSSAINLYDRHQRGVYNPDADQLDQLTILANLLLGSGVFLRAFNIAAKGAVASSASTSSWRILGGITAAVKVGVKPQNLLIIGSVGVDGYQLILITKKAYEEFDAIDRSLSEGEIFTKMLTIWARIGIDVGLYSLNFKFNSSTSIRKEIEKAFETVDVKAVIKAFEEGKVYGKQTTIILNGKPPQLDKIDPKQYIPAYGKVTYKAQPFTDNTHRMQRNKRKVEEPTNLVKHSWTQNSKTKNTYPDNWGKFKDEFNDDFAKRLEEFRGNDDKFCDVVFRGGEGQIFFKISDKIEGPTVLKRWLEHKLVPSSNGKDGFHNSVQLLIDVRNVILKDQELNKKFRVVEIHEYRKDKDWILRDFETGTIKLHIAMEKSPKLKKEVEGLLAYLKIMKTEPYKTLYKRLKGKKNKPSDNLHWSLKDGKIVIIDMM